MHGARLRKILNPDAAACTPCAATEGYSGHKRLPQIADTGLCAAIGASTAALDKTNWLCAGQAHLEAPLRRPEMHLERRERRLNPAQNSDEERAREVTDARFLSYCVRRLLEQELLSLTVNSKFTVTLLYREVDLEAPCN